jgi:hypothetical protein
MEYPFWLKVKKPYQNEKGQWVCPYCGATFPTKEDAYPKLVMTFDGYQNMYKEYPDLRHFLDEQ